MLERKSKIFAKLYEKCHKVIKRNIENTFDICFCNRKIVTSTLMLERKSKISAKLYEKDVKTSKETLKTCLKTAFAMEKQNNCTNVTKKSKISAKLYERHKDNHRNIEM